MLMLACQAAACIILQADEQVCVLTYTHPLPLHNNGAPRRHDFTLRRASGSMPVAGAPHIDHSSWNTTHSSLHGSPQCASAGPQQSFEHPSRDSSLAATSGGMGAKTLTQLSACQHNTRPAEPRAGPAGDWRHQMAGQQLPQGSRPAQPRAADRACPCCAAAAAEAPCLAVPQVYCAPCLTGQTPRRPWGQSQM